MSENDFRRPRDGMSCCVNEGRESYRAVVCDNTDIGKLVSSITTIDMKRAKQLVDALCELALMALHCCLASLTR